MNSGGQVTPSVSATAFLLAEATVRGDPERSGRVEVSTDLQDFDPSGVCGFQGSGSGDRKGLGYALGPILGCVLISVGGYAPHTRVRPRRRVDSRLVPTMVLMKCAASLDAAS
jgi:hypothetical protein